MSTLVQRHDSDGLGTLILNRPDMLYALTVALFRLCKTKCSALPTKPTPLPWCCCVVRSRFRGAAANRKFNTRRWRWDQTRAVTLRTDRTPVAQVGACVGARRLRRAGLGQSPVAGLMAPAILDPHQVANLQVRPYRLPARRLFRGP